MKLIYGTPFIVLILDPSVDPKTTIYNNDEIRAGMMVCLYKISLLLDHIVIRVIKS